jgi:hypothetical protein
VDHAILSEDISVDDLVHIDGTLRQAQLVKLYGAAAHFIISRAKVFVHNAHVEHQVFELGDIVPDKSFVIDWIHGVGFDRGLLVSKITVKRAPVILLEIKSNIGIGLSDTVSVSKVGCIVEENGEDSHCDLLVVCLLFE